MGSRHFSDYASSHHPILKLPHPYLTAYFIVKDSVDERTSCASRMIPVQR